MAEDTPDHDPERIRIGATIKALREAYGLSVTEMARGIEVSGTLISLIENGTRRATMANCRAIARLLGIPLAAITVEGYGRIADEPGVQPEAITGARERLADRKAAS